MAGKKFLAAMQRLRELRLDRVLGDAEFGGDFPMREIFEFAEHENFAATRRQRGDRGGQQVGFLSAAHGLRHSRCLIEDAPRVIFRYRNARRHGPPAQKIARSVARGGK